MPPAQILCISLSTNFSLIHRGNDDNTYIITENTFELFHSLLHQNPKITQQEIEDSFDGHICRCTGYRSILDAMKTFGTDATGPEAKPIDIEVCGSVNSG